MAKNYLGSQEHFEDEINAYYDQKEQREQMERDYYEQMERDYYEQMERDYYEQMERDYYEQQELKQKK